MGTSDFRKRSYGKKGSTINLKVLGATADLPLGIQAYGRDCVGDKANKSKEGYFAYLAAPHKKKSIFVHEKTTADGTVFHVWKSTASRDCPPGRTKVDNKPATPASKVQTSVNSMVRAIESQRALKSIQRLRAMTTLKGRWSGYIECPSGRIVLTRDIANFTTLALVSDPAKGMWQYAIHIKDLKTTHWFTTKSKKVGGVKSVSITGSKGTMVGAFNAAIKELYEVIAKASTVKETVRRASVDRKYRKGRVAKGQVASPLTKSEVKSAASAAKSIKKKAGRISTKVKRMTAKKKTSGRKTATARIRKSPLKSQSSLKGKFITFGSSEAAGTLKNMVAYVAKVGPNGRGNYDPKSGGAKLHILAISKDGKKVSNRLKSGVLELHKGKRLFKVGGAAAFKSAMKKRVVQGATPKNKYPKLLYVADLINDVSGLTQKDVLGIRIAGQVDKRRAEAKKGNGKSKSKSKAKKVRKSTVKSKSKPAAKRAAPKPVAVEEEEELFFF